MGYGQAGRGRSLGEGTYAVGIRPVRPSLHDIHSLPQSSRAHVRACHASNVDVYMREAAVVAHAFLRIHEDYLKDRYGAALDPSPSSHYYDFRVHFTSTFINVGGASFGAALMSE